MPTPASPAWLLGKHLTQVTVVPYTIDPVTGAWTAGTSLDVWGVMDDLDHQTNVEFEDIRPIHSTQQNEEAISFGNAVVLTTLKKSDSGQKLHGLVNTYAGQGALLTWVEGKETFAGYFKVGQLRGGMKGHGRQAVSVDFRPTDPGTAQVTRTVAP